MNADGRVAITGLGVVSPSGNDIHSFWQNSVAGVSGIRPIERFESANFGCKVAGQVERLDESPFYKKKYVKIDPCSAMGLVAASQALAQAGFEG
ncbi:beta-ketoacyl synthase N-terminal-like domain-containing protein, partial [endosymbiont of Lamellibrachia barhami]|uniref:beta-ketoacyl synthase N-terminal-like domain-containing protein n=1 Tax=endosymbiont of Lamellibrachia barhami TaxID=205975 RepID=UPI0024839382